MDLGSFFKDYYEKINISIINDLLNNAFILVNNMHKVGLVHRDIKPENFLFNKNLPISISTDDPPFFSTTLSKEYEALHNAFGWGIEIFNEINKRSLEFAFCDAKLKEKLIQQL